MDVLDHIKEEEEELLPVAKKSILKETLVVILDKFETVPEEKMKEKKKKLG